MNNNDLDNAPLWYKVLLTLFAIALPFIGSLSGF